MPDGDSPTIRIDGDGGGGVVGFTPPTPDVLNAVLEGFEVHGVIGQGGMGAVYRGTQKRLDRTVAIKVMPVDLCVEHRFADRFEREAKAMAKLSHQGVVPVYDFGDIDLPDGTRIMFLVMEYVDGVDLHQLIQARELTLDRSLSIVSQICEAIAYAHSIGIIHRDIKPANVLVDVNRGDAVKVADFGLAKFRGWAQPSMITRDDFAMGSPDYVAPESLEMGVKVDMRADVYSLGVVLYQLLTGKVPRGNYAAPSKVNPVLNRQFDKIVDSAMATDREKRYQTIEELHAAIKKIDKPATNSPSEVSGIRWPWIAAAAVGIGVIVLLIIYLAS